MKTLFLSTTDLTGGAARATYWLGKGLRQSGQDVSMLVQRKTGDDSWINSYPKNTFGLFAEFRQVLDYLPLRLYSRRMKTPWSLNLLPNPGLLNKVSSLNPDIINLHWIGGSFVPSSQLSRFKVPIVWSLYDMWPFTGGCHYDNFCNRFIQSCGSCPQLRSKVIDASKIVMYNKMTSWKNLAITIVAPSRWLASQAQRSSLFKDKRIEVIPHGTDLSIFKPLHKQLARKILGLPEDVDLVLFGSTGGTGDERKGFQYLLPALKVLSTLNEHKNIQLLVFGASAPHTDVNFDFPVHFIGRLRDDISLSVLYAAADVTVTPSLQEAFGMTASESMACGTPVVAFGASGPLDVIDHKINGYLAEPYDIKDLSNGISWVLACKQRWHKLSIASRQKCIDCFDLKIVANMYSNLYEELLSSF